MVLLVDVMFFDKVFLDLASLGVYVKLFPNRCCRVDHTVFRRLTTSISIAKNAGSSHNVGRMC